MKAPASPLDEADRLQALRALKLLDSAPDPTLDRITELARSLLGTPIALVSLIDENRQWFKSRQGLDAAETPRDISFCGHAILGDDTFVVPDASRDARFHDNPLVTGAPDIRFYAGAPLHAPGGARIGTLCVIDRQPRALDARQESALRALAALVDAEIAAQSARNATATLVQQENYLRAVLDNISEGVLTVTERQLILSANPAACRLLGYEAAQLIGMKATDLLTDKPDSPAQLQDGALFFRLQVRRGDGSRRDIEVTVTELTTDGARNRILLLRDVSARRELERLKEEFVATVSHELRTPLTSIRGSLGLLAGGAAGEIPAKARAVLDIATRNAERLGLLIDDLLDLEKLSAGGMEMHRERVAVDELLRQAKNANDGYALRHQVRIELGTAPSTIVDVDPHRMQQVLSNLLSNAVKFSPAGGSVELAAQTRAGGIRISVRDHGPGIPEEFRARMFERFAQADGSSTRQRGGTGLGLNIARAIAQKHGGDISFATETGVGTTFFVDLPSAP